MGLHSALCEWCGSTFLRVSEAVVYEPEWRDTIDGESYPVVGVTAVRHDCRKVEKVETKKTHKRQFPGGRAISFTEPGDAQLFDHLSQMPSDVLWDQLIDHTEGASWVAALILEDRDGRVR